MIETVSALIGWTYVIGWGVANYPTIISNTQLKSVQGISIDYMYFNALGYILYTLYTGTMWRCGLVREEFFLQNGGWPLIKVNDVVFAAHNLLTNSLILSQAYLWGFKRNDNQRLSALAKVLLSLVGVYVAASTAYIYGSQGLTPVAGRFNWAALCTSLGVVKIGMSVCKNVPQILYNYRRQSTHGWPILMIWLDAFGGVFSLLQLLLDAWAAHDLAAVLHNKPKLFLSVQVILADCVFFFQHYYLYYARDVQTYGPFKTDPLAGYHAVVQEDEDFLIEHARDHDHPLHVHCTVSPNSKDELQRLLP